MMTRATSKIVIFAQPLIVDAADGEQLPGIYPLETEEELLRCQSTGGVMRVVNIDPRALVAARARDVRAE